MSEYPPYWLCKVCERPFEVHLKMNEKALEYSTNGEGVEVNNADNWCFADELPRTSKYELSFEPVDNLTQIELLAKQKNLTDE